MTKSLGDRMKEYEVTTKQELPTTFPIIIRVDGKSFHTLTRGLGKPFDERLIKTLQMASVKTCWDMMNVRMAYLQSDEISFVLYPRKRVSDAWFGNTVQKLASITASMVTAYANKYAFFKSTKPMVFDARVFPIPLEEITNYMIWRQQDWERNSVQMYARSMYSHKDCQNKSQPELHEMIHKKGYNWAELEPRLKRGSCIVYDASSRIDRWYVDNNIPIFKNDREYIEKRLNMEE